MLRVERDLSVLERLIRHCRGKPARVVTDGTEYGVHVEFGTHAHVIEPRRKKALYWPGAQHPVKRVHHPGTAPHPFMGPAVESVRPAYEAGIRQVGNWEQADAFIEKIARDVQAHARANAPVDTSQLRNSIDVYDAETFLESLR